MSTAICYFLARGAHLNVVEVNFVDGFSRLSFTPDGTYALASEITCVGLDSDEERRGSTITLHFDHLPSSVRI